MQAFEIKKLFISKMASRQPPQRRYIRVFSEFDGKGITANDRRQKPACAV
jgi:hypothetical protein